MKGIPVLIPINKPEVGMKVVFSYKHIMTIRSVEGKIIKLTSPDGQLLESPYNLFELQQLVMQHELSDSAGRWKEHLSIPYHQWQLALDNLGKEIEFEKQDVEEPKETYPNGSHKGIRSWLEYAYIISPPLHIWDKDDVENLQNIGKALKEPMLYTQEEVIQLLIKERQRAVDIAYDFKNMHDKSYREKKSACNDLAFIERDIANECRLVGNAISGLNALSVALGKTIESEIRAQFKK